MAAFGVNFFCKYLKQAGWRPPRLFLSKEGYPKRASANPKSKLFGRRLDFDCRRFVAVLYLQPLDFGFWMIMYSLCIRSPHWLRFGFGFCNFCQALAPTYSIAWHASPHQRIFSVWYCQAPEDANPSAHLYVFVGGECTMQFANGVHRLTETTAVRFPPRGPLMQQSHFCPQL